MPRSTPLRPHTPPPPWSPLTDDQWLALLPYLLPRSPHGIRCADLRARMDAIFHHAHTDGAPWKNLPRHFGRPDTVHRFFRRLTHAGLWHRLLSELAVTGPRHPLKSLEYAICRATRRAARLGGLPLILLIRRLGFVRALNGPPWLMPDPDLSETCRRALPTTLPTTLAGIAALKPWLRSLHWLARAAMGRRRIHPAVRWRWA